MKSGVGKSVVATLKSGVDIHIIIIIIKFIIKSLVVISEHYRKISVHLKYKI